MKPKILYTTLLLCILSYACDDLLEKDITVKQADFPAMLSITATLDSDSTFTVVINDARPLSYFETFRPNIDEGVYDGEVRLYEDGKLILSETINLVIYVDMSRRRFTWNKIGTKVGSTYRIEVEFDEYPLAYAEEVMPEAAKIDKVVMENTSKEWEKAIWIYPLNDGNPSEIVYTGFPLSFELTDNNGTTNDYYLIRAQDIYQEWYKRFYEDKYTLIRDELIGIDLGITDMALAQENPDIESMGFSMDEDNMGMYSLRNTIISDATFRNSSRSFSIYVGGMKDPFANESVQTGTKPSGSQDTLKVVAKKELIVTRISENTFNTYRSLAFQLKGVGFFSEPVSIPNNFVGGMGCFSVQQSTKVAIFDRTLWGK